MKHSLRVTDVTRCASVTFKPRSTYVCHWCRHIAFVSARRARAPPPVSYIQRRFASDDWTERLRQKLWGTTNPPGQADPYSHESPRDEDEERDTTVTQPQDAPPRKWSTEKSDTGDYVPATSWDGLDQIGGKDEWWEEAWNQRHPFEGFMGPTKMESREEISEVIHRALVEIYTLKEARVPMEIFMSYAETPEAHYFKDVSFKQDADGTTVPVFASEELREQVLDSLTEVENPPATNLEVTVDDSQASDREETELITNNSTVHAEEAPDREEADLITNNSTVQAEEAPDREKAELITINSTIQAEEAPDQEEAESTTENSTVQAEEAPDMLQKKSLENQEGTEREEPVLNSRSNDETWLNVSFHDPNTKFAIIKRVMQLTGVRIPDPSIDSINSAKALLGFLVKKPKPKKLAQFLLADENLNNLPNVKIMDRRYTPIDKEKQVGRLKVIEKELTRQGLPVTGGRENVWNPAKT